MATSRLNSEEFVNLVNGLKGVILVYKSTDRDGNEKETAQQFFGADYEPKENKTQDEIFRVWKKCGDDFLGLSKPKKSNCVRRTTASARNSAPQLRVPSSSARKGETVKRFDLEESVWAKMVLYSTKKDFERTARDYKKAIRDPLQKRPFVCAWFPCGAAKRSETTGTTTCQVPAAVTVETTAGTVAEQAGAKSKGKGQ